MERDISRWFSNTLCEIHASLRRPLVERRAGARLRAIAPDFELLADAACACIYKNGQPGVKAIHGHMWYICCCMHG